MWSVFKTVGPHLWRYRRGLALGMGSLLLKDIISASLPLIIRAGVDSLTSGFKIQIVVEFAAFLVGLSLLKGIFQYWMRVILIGMSRDIEFDLRNQLLSHRRHYGALHQRSECRAHDAGPGHHVLDRNHVHRGPLHRRYDVGGLEAHAGLPG